MDNVISFQEFISYTMALEPKWSIADQLAVWNYHNTKDQQDYEPTRQARRNRTFRLTAERFVLCEKCAPEWNNATPASFKTHWAQRSSSTRNRRTP
jgi:hypothetical protein